MNGLDPWLFECKGKVRAGDSEGTSNLHVWRRKPNGTAECLKCGTTLTVEEATRCFTDYTA